MDADMARYIREEIKKQLNVLLFGSTSASQSDRETISDMFPGMPKISERPKMMPYGVASSAPDGTVSVVGRIGEHFGNRMVMGHRDANRPTTNSGETILYNEHGQRIYLENGNIRIGTKSSSNPLVLGTELKAMLKELISQELATHTHITGAPGSPTSPPQNASNLQAIDQNNVSNDKIFSDYVFTQKAP